MLPQVACRKRRSRCNLYEGTKPTIYSNFSFSARTCTTRRVPQSRFLLEKVPNFTSPRHIDRDKIDNAPCSTSCSKWLTKNSVQSLPHWPTTLLKKCTSGNPWKFNWYWAGPVKIFVNDMTNIYSIPKFTGILNPSKNFIILVCVEWLKWAI